MTSSGTSVIESSTDTFKGFVMTCLILLELVCLI